MENQIGEIIDEHRNMIRQLKSDKELLPLLSKLSREIAKSFKYGGSLLICGNGGSASDSQHIATELVSRFFLERDALNAEALTVNTSTLTAVANDYDFDLVFSRQVEAKGKQGDILLAISTSGNSRNVIEAVKAASQIGMISIGLSGSDKKSEIFRVADYCVSVPSNSVPRIQEAHIMIGHILCEMIEKILFDKGDK